MEACDQESEEPRAAANLTTIDAAMMNYVSAQGDDGDVAVFKSDPLSPTLESLLDIIAFDFLLLETKPKGRETQQARHQQEQQLLYEDEERRLVTLLLEEWPSSEPSAEGFESTMLNGKLAVEKNLSEWRLHRNWQLSEYVHQSQKILDRYPGTNDTSVPRPCNEQLIPFYCPDRGSIIPSLSYLLVRSVPYPPRPWSVGAPLTKNVCRSVRTFTEQDKTMQYTTPSKGILEHMNILEFFRSAVLTFMSYTICTSSHDKRQFADLVSDVVLSLDDE
ncbi:uncharacterized protein RAG0_03078 [Rhynchosporium agropyri]|uniref:Uncharacterized protein n=1 Tax=Rhynchosporium agropyri TaxID=914238 RepID=A0A1E1K2X8_9HELO|nr:uncharacterized protein RAG0_03078 [Rhynchosporium agropyri]